MDTDGIIVHLANHREADRIVECLTPKGGRRRFFAPCARRSRRRFGGLDLFARVHLCVQVGATRSPSGMPTLAAADLLDARSGLRAHLEGVVVAGLLCRALRAMMPLDGGGPECPRAFAALEAALDAAAGPRWPAALAFLPALCRSQGLLPAAHCIVCRDPRRAAAMGVVPGGLVHLACRRGAVEVAAEVPALLSGAVPTTPAAARALVAALAVLTAEAAPGALARRGGLDEVLWP